MLRFRLNVRQRATKGNNLSLRDVSVLPEILEPKPKRIDVPISVGSRSAMSQMGQNRTWRGHIAMSALLPKADIPRRRLDVRFGP